MKFTVQQKQKWSQLYQQGRTPTEIAKTFGTTSQNVAYWLICQGLKSRSKPTNQTLRIGQKAYRMRQTTQLTWPEISVRLTFSPDKNTASAAHAYAYENELAWPPTVRYPPEMKAEWIRLYRSGLSMQQIADLHQTNRQTICNAIQAAGVQARPRVIRPSPDKERKAYKMREDGKTWKQISAHLWRNPYRTFTVAANAAERYARDHRLPWPLPMPPRVLDPRNRRAYMLRAKKLLPWKEIGDRLWPDSTNPAQAACNAAYRYAMQGDHRWPLRKRIK